ncbi:MAG: hypothetical protein NTW60_04370 [Candidatus Wolfebacteria bacterium]|nr:hypothetical protein [Candidatus Wolfebacteria bacterium]
MPATELPPSGYNGPVAEHPNYFKGDWWRYQLKNGEEMRLVFDHQEIGPRGNLNVFRSRSKNNNVLLYVTQGLGIAKRIGAVTGKVFYNAYEAHPGQTMEEVEFPIWIGKKWEYNQPVRDTDTGIYLTARVKYEVADYEVIQLKAGEYEVFKIIRKYETKGSRGNIWQGEEIFWYSPKAKNIVKYENDVPKELTSAKVAP